MVPIPDDNSESNAEYAKALARQQFTGQVTAVTGGATNLLGQGMSLANRYNWMQTKAPAEQLDAYGNPLYNLGGLNAQLDVTPRGARAGDVLSGAASGAAAGSAFGLPGTIIGTGVGAISSLISGAIGKKRGEKRKELAAQNLAAAQRTYSLDKNFANNKQLGMGDYERLNNNYARLQNLYDVMGGGQQNG